MRSSLSVLLLLFSTVTAAPAGAQGVLPSASDVDTAAVRLPLEPASDEEIEARLQQVFSRVEEFENVEVDVRDGVVRLHGTVLQSETRTRVEELASRFQGVVYVDNDLTAETDVETRLTPAVDRLRDYAQGAAAFLPVLGVALLVILLFGLVSMLIGRWNAPRERFGVNPLVWGLVRRLLRALVFLLGLLLAFDILGITTMVGAVLGTAGIVGLAIGFAFQDIVENYLAGMLLSLRRPFSVNDLVKIGEHEGRVVRLTSRELLLLSLEGNHIRLPNATVFKGNLVNYSLNPRRLFHFEAGISVEEDLERAMQVGIETLNAMNGVMNEPPPFARVRELGESTVVVRFHGWVDQQHADFFKVESEAIRLVKAALDEAGIEMPEPIYRVLLRQLPDIETLSRQTTRPPAHEQAREIDVAPDGRIEAQVQEDLTREDDENLLTR